MNYKKIKEDNSELKIWKVFPDGTSIGTLGYSKKNVPVLKKLLMSFAEQYGEHITYEAAEEELKLYSERGKLFVLFDKEGNAVSMNGVTYNEDNISVDFKKYNGEKPTNLYFYGLSTVKEYRGRGACHKLIDFAIKYAYHNDFDLVYARTDLVDSNSEWIMEQAGLEVCTENDDIITEYVPVDEFHGDYRLHLWLPLKEDLYLESKSKAIFADKKNRQLVKRKGVVA